MIEQYDWKIGRVHIPASSLQKAKRRKRSLLGGLTNFFALESKTKNIVPKTEYDLSPIFWLGRVDFLRHIEITIDQFTPEVATYLVRKLSEATKGMVSFLKQFLLKALFRNRFSDFKWLDSRCPRYLTV